MKRCITISALLLPLLLATSGCVVHVGGGDYGDRDGKVVRQENRNREAISSLALGTSIDQVRAQLGQPIFTDATTVKGEEVRVLRYRTHRVRADGDTTPDETTPLVFHKGLLTGIGERAVEAAMAP